MRTIDKKQVQLMRLALGLSGLPCTDATAETVILVTNAFGKLGGKFSLRDAANIETTIYQKYFKNKIVSTEKIKGDATKE